MWNKFLPGEPSGRGEPPGTATIVRFNRLPDGYQAYPAPICFSFVVRNR